MVHLTVILTLFVLSIVSIAVAASAALSYEYLLNYQDALFTPLAMIWRFPLGYSTKLRLSYILASFIADIYFTYRCFIIGGQLKRAIILPSILIVVALIFQIVEVEATGEYGSMDENVAAYCSMFPTFFANIVLTLLTAGRIWWIGRKANLILNERIQSKYNRTIQIILESGLLYPVTLLPPIIIWSRGEIGYYGSESFIAVTLSIVTIAPTLIVVRVGLGIAAIDVPTTVQTFKAVYGPRAMTMDEGSGMSISVIDIRRSTTVTALSTPEAVESGSLPRRSGRMPPSMPP